MAHVFTGLAPFINEADNRTKFWLESLYSNDAMPFVRAVGSVYPGVKENSFKLPLLTANIGIASGDDCVSDFDNGNDTTMTQSTVNLVKGFIGDSMCPHGENWEDYITALGMPAGQHYTSLGEWQPYLVAEIQRQVGKRLGVNLWQGDQSAAGDTWTFSGWHEQLLAATLGTFDISSNVSGGIVGAGATPTSGGATGADAAGVYNICEALVEAAVATQEVNGNDLAADLIAGNCYIVMNPLNREFLRQNYQKKFGLQMPEIAAGLVGLQNNAMGAFNFPGYNLPVIVQAWIPQGTILLSRKGNQVVAFDLESDFTKMSMGMDQYEESLWWKYRFKVGAAWRALNGGNVKVYGPTS